MAQQARKAFRAASQAWSGAFSDTPSNTLPGTLPADNNPDPEPSSTPTAQVETPEQCLQAVTQDPARFLETLRSQQENATAQRDEMQSIETRAQNDRRAFLALQEQQEQERCKPEGARNASPLPAEVERATRSRDNHIRYASAKCDPRDDERPPRPAPDSRTTSHQGRATVQ